MEEGSERDSMNNETLVQEFKKILHSCHEKDSYALTPSLPSLSQGTTIKCRFVLFVVGDVLLGFVRRL